MILGALVLISVLLLIQKTQAERRLDELEEDVITLIRMSQKEGKGEDTPPTDLQRLNLTTAEITHPDK